ncbi:MAG TPA: RNA polymerase sigma factor [Chloroflexi bacterium]|nr:RNA polymerase sigma factor [Chloroflexota bacterium]
MSERTNETWLSSLRSKGAARELALQDLRAFIFRGVMGYLHSRSDLSRLDIKDLEQLAEDAVQDALIKIQNKLDTFQGKSKFTTWATKIAINHLISELRRHHWRDVSLQEMIEGGTTLEDVIAAGPGHPGNPSVSAEREMVWQAIVHVLENELTDRQRQALVITQLKDVPLTEAAAILNTNTNNLYKLLHDARLKLKKKMTAQGLEPSYILELFAQ